jgi:hypothetical protein
VGNGAGILKVNLAGHTIGSSEAIINNGDGTETVMVTDSAAVSATGAHYIRLRIVMVEGG